MADTWASRYYSLDSHNISFSLLTAYGNWKMHGHYPPPCTGAKKRGDRTCSIASMNRDSLRAARHKFTKVTCPKSLNLGGQFLRV